MRLRNTAREVTLDAGHVPNARRDSKQTTASVARKQKRPPEGGRLHPSVDDG
jgi:hypothetical protein